MNKVIVFEPVKNLALSADSSDSFKLKDIILFYYLTKYTEVVLIAILIRKT